MTAVLDVSGLSVGLGRRGPGVLADVSFSVAPGRVLGLVGESGAGKSMIGRVIAGDLPAGFGVTAGSVRFAGRDLLATAPRARRALLGRQIAFIPQEPQSALNPVRTIGSQFGEHLRQLGLRSGRARWLRMLSLLDSVQLRDGAALLGRYPHQLSGGQCQRMLIAMAFAGAPKLVVADEPTTALDVTVQARVMDVLKGLQARHGTAVVFVTHDLRLAGDVCDDILVLYAGRPVERGPARTVLEAPRHPYTRCLLLANPPLHGAARGLYVLPDQMPGLAAMSALPGCRFAPRCPVVQPDCTIAPPPMVDAGSPGHWTGCRYPDATSGIQAPPLSIRRPRAAAAKPVLTVAGLAKTFLGSPRLLGPRRQFVALHPASLSVAEGEFVGVVGESGSGKSTLARLIVGLERPSAGQIVLDGVDVTAGRAGTRLHRVRTAQMVFQNPQSALNPRRRVSSIVTQAMEAASPAPGRGAREDRARQLLAAVGMAAETGARFPFQLSGGQRQRVNVARALCVLPRLLVADEIASGLDVSIQAQLLALLQRLRDELGFAMLFISHDLSVVRHLCDRVLVLHDGIIVEAGRTQDVFDDPQHPYTRRLLAAVPGAVPATAPAVQSVLA